MRKSYKHVLINTGIAAAITILLLIGYGTTSGSDVAFTFGLVCLGLGVINFLIGLVMLIIDSKTVRDGWLLSGAILLLLSGISCGSGLSGMRF